MGMKNKNSKSKKSGVRLSKHVSPVAYDIQLRPDLENFTFQGKETITLNVLEKTKVLTLHSKELEINTAEVMIGEEKIFAKISYTTKSETVNFKFPKIIPIGKIKLTLVFKGILNDKMRGFYRSKYLHLDKEHNMATTQFEATDARRAFPCFDEPARKAIFNVSLVIPNDKTAISNTLPASVAEHDTGFKIVTFTPTPKMSTYLLAFIVGDFEYIKKKSNRGVSVKVYTIPGKKHQAKFALDCTVKMLEFYEKYFDIPYPLKTLDMIAIPDFSSLAMENWGAITFREIGLLVDEKQTSIRNKEMVAHVIAHELAHQWFGNLVTMEWWTHLWLNEGFASYISYLATDKLFPEWDMWTQFCTDDLGTALNLDALITTHPIEVEVHHPDEIGEIFDAVSYSKGASIIRMLADYIGEKDFRDGLRFYLKKHSYKNTETINLWQAFEKVSKKPKGSLTKMMHNWTSKPGYPVVKVELKDDKINLSQERFFASPISAKKSRDKTIWQVPMTIKHKNIARKHFFGRLSQAIEPKISNFRAGKNTTAKKIVSSVDFTKVNLGEAGFYRTAYSPELLEKLIEPVLNKNLPPSDRLGVIRDLFALAQAGTTPTTDALKFLKAYKNEDNFTVWLEIAMGLARLEQLLSKRRKREKFDAFARELFSPVARQLGWIKKKSETHTQTLLRSLAISRAGRSGDEKIIKEARKKFQAIQAGKHVDPDIHGAIYGIVATWGTAKDYSALVRMYKNETLHEEKNRISSALGDFKDQKILYDTCNFAISKNVRAQDTISILSSVGSNPFGRDVWWNFIRRNWKTLVTRYGEGGLNLGRAVKAISGSAEEKHLKAIKKFFKTAPAPGAKRAIDQLLERLESNVAWLKRDGKIIEKFLENKIT